MKHCGTHGTFLENCTALCEHERTDLAPDVWREQRRAERAERGEGPRDTLPSAERWPAGSCPKRPSGAPCARNMAELQCAFCGRPLTITAPYAWESDRQAVTATDILKWLADAREQQQHCRPGSPEAEEQRRILLLCNALLWARAPDGRRPTVKDSMASIMNGDVDYLRATDPILRQLGQETEGQARRISELQETADRVTKCWHCHDALIPPEPMHCERCPSFGDCHVRNCPEPGCEEKEPHPDDE